MAIKIRGLVEITLAIALMAAIFYFSADIARLAAYGYVGVFLISLLSSATILFPCPAWVAVIAMSGYLDPLLIGIIGGVGAAIGELTGYMAGNGARSLLNNKIKETKKIEEMVKKYDVASIFVLSFIPNPLFDVAGIIAGGLKMPLWRFLAACALGRVLRYSILAMIGAFTLEYII
jgi:membrane protein YqaA with SNARE-associated domain